MFKNIINKMHNMNWKDRLMSGLWLFTLVILFVFVISAATLNKGGKVNDKKDGYTITVKKKDFTVTHADEVTKLIPAVAATSISDGIPATPASEEVQARPLNVKEVIKLKEIDYVTPVDKIYTSKINNPTVTAVEGEQAFIFKVDFKDRVTKPVTNTDADIAEVKKKDKAFNKLEKAKFVEAFENIKFTVNGLGVTFSKRTLTEMKQAYTQTADSVSKTFDNVMASLALVFTLSIFGSLGTTVGIKFVERQNKKRGVK